MRTLKNPRAGRSRRTWMTGMLLVMLAATTSGLWLRASDDVGAAGELSFTWSIEQRFGQDANGDGKIDYSQAKTYLQPSAWDVSFNACKSPAAKDAPNGATYKWTFKRGTDAAITKNGDCDITQPFAELGKWTVTAKLLSKDGAQLATVSDDVTPKDVFIVSLGDSVASGEGNPDTLKPKELGPFPFYGPDWQNEKCHRSALAGPAQAARRIEQRDPHSAVTFLHLACSGATIDKGLLGEYEGVSPDGTPEPAQIDRAVQLAGGRTIDAMLVSIGANNAKFPTIVETCVKFANCQSFNLPGIKNAQQIFDESITTLEPLYAQLDDKLDGLQKDKKVGQVFLTEYYDPSTGDNEDYCDGLTQAERDANVTPDGKVVDGISKSEWTWASQTVVKGVNDALTAGIAAANGDGVGKWNLVGGIANDFKGHGSCATDRWVRTLFESFAYQRDQYGAFHPNAEGHLYSYGTRIEKAVVNAFDLGGTFTAPSADKVAGIAADGLESWIGVLDTIDAVQQLVAKAPFGAGTQINGAMNEVFAFLANLQTKFEQLSADASQSLTQFDNWLDDPDENGDPTRDFQVAGFVVDIGGSISPHLPATEYEVGFSLKITHDGGGKVMQYLADNLDLSGATLKRGIVFDTNATFNIKPTLGKADPKRFTLNVPEGPLGSIGLNLEADLGGTDPDVGNDLAPLEFNVGMIDVKGTGIVKATPAVGFAYDDPNDDGVIDLSELTTANIAVSCVPSPARLELAAQANIAGLEGEVGRISLNDQNLCDGLSAPELTLGELDQFLQITPADLINGLAQLTNMLRSLQTSGDLDIPFIKEGLSSVVDVSDRLVKFFVDEGLTDPENPLATVKIPITDPSKTPEILKNYTIDKLLPKIADALGLPFPIAAAASPVAVDYSNDKLTIDIDHTFDPAAITNAGTFDFGDQLQKLGLSRIASASGAAKASIDPEVGLDVGFGIDLSPGLQFSDRFYLKLNNSGPEAWLDATVEADVDLEATLAVLGVTLKDDNAEGTVSLLERKDSTKPMVQLEVNGRGDDRLTLTELADGNAAFPFSGTINAKVPPFNIDVAGTLAGENVAGGKIGISWADVTSLNTLSVTPTDLYVADLLPLLFDPANPTALINRILQVTREGIVRLDDWIKEDPEATASIPLVGKGLADLEPVLGELRATLDDLIATTTSIDLPAVEAAVENALGDALGLAEDDPKRATLFSLEHIAADDAEGTPAAIQATLDLGACTSDRVAGRPSCTKDVGSAKLPINLGVGDVSGIAGVQGTGDVNLSFDAALHLVVGVELPTVTPGATPTSPPVASGQPALYIRDDSSFTVGVGGDATGSLAATLGPVQVNLGKNDPAAPAAEKLDAHLRARFTMERETPTNQRLIVTPGAPLPSATDAWFQELLGDWSELSDNPMASCAGVAGTYDACARIPVYLNNTDLGDIVFKAPDLMDPSGWTFEGADTILENLSSEPMQYRLLLEGLRSLVERLETTLANAPPGQKIPLLGVEANAGADVLKAFREKVVEPVQTLANNIANFNAGQVRTEVKNFFMGQIGPSAPVDQRLLLDGPDAGTTINADDIVVTLMCGSEGAETACADSATPGSIRRFEVDMVVGKEGEASTPPFDIGFPGLRLASEGSLTATAGFRMNLGFGIDKSTGFYIKTNSSPELFVGAQAQLPNVGDATVPDLTGDLAFLPVTIEDKHAGVDVKAGLGVNLTAANNRLSFQAMDTLSIEPTVTACANVQLGLQVTAPEEVASSLPKLLADFVVEGGYNCSGDLNTGIGSTRATGFNIRFDDVKVDMGSFMDEFIGPAVQEVRKYTGPLEPTVEQIKKPIPGVAEAAELAGLDAPTWYDAFKAAAQATGNTNGLQLIDRVIQLIDLAKTLGNASDAGGLINIGDFTVSDTKVDEPVTPDQAGSVIATSAPQGGSILGRLTEAGVDSQAATKLTQAKNTGGFTFPAFENPSSLFQLLVGKDVTLVRFDAGKLGVQRGFKFQYPIGPFLLYVGGSAGVEGRFAAGFDTYGLRQAYQALSDDDPANDGFFDVAGGLVQSFFIDDLDAQGKDVPEIVLKAELVVGAAVGVPGLSVGAEGGVRGIAELNLHDDDGKVRFEDIAAQIELNPNPVCFFDISARIEAFIRAVLSTPLGDVDYPIADVVLLDMPNLTQFCRTRPDGTLTGKIHPGGVLEVYTGPTADTLTVETRGGGVVHVSSKLGDEDFTGVTKVFVNGNGGDDRISITQGEGGAALPALLCGGAGRDSLIATAGPSELYGDNGPGIPSIPLECADAGQSSDNDSLTGSSGVDTMVGGDKNDTFLGEGGNDVISGELGDDTIRGGLGNDIINGGDGKDSTDYLDRDVPVTANLGSPMGQAGETDNVSNVEAVIGGRGNDTMGAPGSTIGIRFEGSAGNDTITGGPKDDLVLAGEGNDDLRGGDGKNQLYGGPGDDEYFAGIGADLFSGGEGSDTADYSALTKPVNVRIDNLTNDGAVGEAADNVIDADVLLGTTKDDVLGGGNPGERIVGGTGNDRVEGGGGDDDLDAGTGNDSVEGGAGHDDLRGRGGADTLEGGSGGDLLNGGAGSDTVSYSLRSDGVEVDLDAPGCDGSAADLGRPPVSAGCGMDDVRPNIEKLIGSAGNDTLLGTPEAEVILGGGGNDTIAGRNGADRLEGEDGDDALFDAGPRLSGTDSDVDTLLGGEGNDGLVSHGGNDVLDGGNGDDRAEGSSGNDVINGGFGADVLRGGGGTDIADGGEGNDSLRGDAGIDNLLGGFGDDGIVGGLGGDTINGGDGDDDLVGSVESGSQSGDGVDLITGGDGDDLLSGGIGNDVLNAGDGRDRLEGGDNNDGLLGGLGNDKLFGGNDADTLTGGGGDDVEQGEAGDDTFNQETLSNGGDRISGGDGVDKVDYSKRVAAVTVTKDGKANDGAAGEKDNVGTDVEDLLTKSIAGFFS